MTNQEHDSLVARFPFAVPAGYRWLIDRGLAGFEPNSALQPWYLLPREQVFSVSDRWPRAAQDSTLFAFARRQDCDDLACLAMRHEDRQLRVVVVHGWTPEGYDVVAEFDTIWNWLRSVVRDIEEWVALGDE